jgi:predicted transcriptional regulator
MSIEIDKNSSAVYKMTMITPQQIRGARAMLGMTQGELAQRAGISTTGLNNIERGISDPKASTLSAIETALESAGVKFVAEDNWRGVMHTDRR